MTAFKHFYKFAFAMLFLVLVSALDLPTGTQVEVIILVEDEQDTTEYLLSTEANRKYLEEALEELKHPEKFVQVDIENL